jgi:hypothetical protein
MDDVKEVITIIIKGHVVKRVVENGKRTASNKTNTPAIVRKGTTNNTKILEKYLNLMGTCSMEKADILTSILFSHYSLHFRLPSSIQEDMRVSPLYDREDSKDTLLSSYASVRTGNTLSLHVFFVMHTLNTTALKFGLSIASCIACSAFTK